MPTPNRLRILLPVTLSSALVLTGVSLAARSLLIVFRVRGLQRENREVIEHADAELSLSGIVVRPRALPA